MQSPKIFLVANTSWYLYNFRKGVILTALSKEFEVFCLAPKDDYSKLLIDLGVKHIDIIIDAKGTNIISDLKFLKHLSTLYSIHRPDFVFHYTIKPNIYGSIAAARFKIPCISIVSGAGIVFLKKNFLFKLVKQLYKQSCRLAKETWFVNKDDYEFFEREGIVNKRKSKILPGEGINTTHFKRSTLYKELPRPVTFVFSARLLWVKGIGYYINAARRLLDEKFAAKFLLMGFFENNSKVAVKLEDVACWQEEGIIDFLGPLEDVRPILEQVHCLVFPSYYREGVPRVLLEAASMEIPIITTDNVGCRDVVKHGTNGFLVNVCNADEVYERMKEIILMNPDRQKEMGEEGRRLVLEEFDERFVLRYYQNVFSEISLKLVSKT